MNLQTESGKSTAFSLLYFVCKKCNETGLCKNTQGIILHEKGGTDSQKSLQRLNRIWLIYIDVQRNPVNEQAVNHCRDHPFHRLSEAELTEGISTES